MYTLTLGPWAEIIFMVSAFMALYSTLFTAAASFTRIFTDAFGQLGWLPFYHYPTRKKTIAILAWVFPIAWCSLFLFFKLKLGRKRTKAKRKYEQDGHGGRVLF